MDLSMEMGQIFIWVGKNILANLDLENHEDMENIFIIILHIMKVILKME